ncbi:hypothetical protein ABTE18_22015, partial [Acinetobacter baumannii]
TTTLNAIYRISEACSNFYESIRREKTFINPRKLGTIFAFELSTANHGYLNSISTTITNLALTKGIFLRPLGNTVYIMP